MKTPIQELIEQLKEERDGFLKLPPLCSIQERTENCFGSCIEIAERMLEKEKEAMCKFAEFIAEDHWRLHNVDYQINLYEWKHAEGDVKTTNELFETFNTKEK